MHGTGVRTLYARCGARYVPPIPIRGTTSVATGVAVCGTPERWMGVMEQT